MKTLLARLENGEQFLFAEGWVFLLPVFLLYLSACRLDISPVYIRTAATAIHLAMFFLFLIYLSERVRNAERREWACWISLFCFFWACGAYLEFPADPWAHVQRIFQWDHAESIRAAPAEIRLRYASFLAWTIFARVDPLWRRPLFDLYGAFWQFLFSYQLYLFSRRLGFSRAWSYVQVLGTICLFGTNVFGFRYYAISSTPLAYVAYLRCLIIEMDVLEGQFRRASALLVLVPLIYFNHWQEILLLGVSSSALVLAWWYEGTSRQARRRLLWLLVSAGVISLPIGYWLRHHFAQAYLPLGTGYVSAFGIFRLWGPHTTFFETMAVPGILGTLAALILFPVMPRLSALTLAPVFLILSPVLPFIFIRQSRPASDAYRLLYALPESLILVSAIRLAMMRYASKREWLASENSRAAWTCAFLVFCGLFPRYPWRGRLYFQLHQPPAELSLRATDETASWLWHYRDYGVGCEVIADSATNTAVSAQLGRAEGIYRRKPDYFGRILTDQPALIEAIRNGNICALLVADPRQMAPTPPSAIARLSGHWLGEFSQKDWLILPGFVNAAREVLKWGWSGTKVPPYYTLYEPPLSTQWVIMAINDATHEATANLVQFPDGHNWMIDVGPEDRRVTDYLHDAHIDSLDAVVITAPSEKYFGGLRSLAKAGIPIQEIYVGATSDGLKDALRTLRQGGGPYSGAANECISLSRPRQQPASGPGTGTDALRR